jgi:hypothetical protein
MYCYWLAHSGDFRRRSDSSLFYTHIYLESRSGDELSEFRLVAETAVAD